jgi:hypothetical protein
MVSNDRGVGATEFLAALVGATEGVPNGAPDTTALMLTLLGMGVFSLGFDRAGKATAALGPPASEVSAQACVAVTTDAAALAHLADGSLSPMAAFVGGHIRVTAPEGVDRRRALGSWVGVLKQAGRVLAAAAPEPAAHGAWVELVGARRGAGGTGTTHYTVRVAPPAAPERTVERRYSEFQALYTALRAQGACFRVSRIDSSDGWCAEQG